MITLSQKQGQAVKGVTKQIKDGAPVTLLDGPAGSGKSTLLPYVIDDLGIDPQSIAFLGPTARSAKVMRKKLRTSYPGATPSTIHSAMYRAKPAPVGKIETDLYEHQEKLQQYRAETPADDVDMKLVNQLIKAIQRLEMELEALYRDDKLNFQLNVDSQLSLASLIVCDERSMIPQSMADDLGFFGVQILALGDPFQLRPIEGEIGWGVKADYYIDEVHRQARDNPILHIATLARNGDDIPVGRYGDTVEVMRRKDYEHDFDKESQEMIIVGTNKTRWKITSMFRENSGIIEDGRDVRGPQLGEPLMVKKNNREYPQLINGTSCTALSDANMQAGHTTMLLSFEDEDGTEYHNKTVFQGLFEEHYSKVPGKFSSDSRSAYKSKQRCLNMDFNYVSTCHSAQGGEWPDVVVVDESGVFRKEASNWLYVACTRASETLKVLV